MREDCRSCDGQQNCPLVQGNKSEHVTYTSLDGLRAISIFLVVLSHLIQWKHVSLGLVGGYGALGVHIFFVLSYYLVEQPMLRLREKLARAPEAKIIPATEPASLPALQLATESRELKTG